MTDITPERLSELEGLADTVAEKYQVAAFRELVRRELGYIYDSQYTACAGGNNSIQNSPPSIDDLPELSAIKKMDASAKVAWAIMELTSKGEEATAKQVKKIIREKLGVTPPANISRSLQDLTPEYAERVRHGREYRYAPNSNTVKLFQKKDDSD